jgi:hypothetical protein
MREKVAVLHKIDFVKVKNRLMWWKSVQLWEFGPSWDGMPSLKRWERREVEREGFGAGRGDLGEEWWSIGRVEGGGFPPFARKNEEWGTRLMDGRRRASGQRLFIPGLKGETWGTRPY